MAANECTVSLTLTVTPFFGTFLFFSSFEKSVGRRMRIEREWSGVEWWGILTAGLLFISRRQAEEIKKSGQLATSWKFLMLCGNVHPTTNGAPRLIATCCYSRTISLIFCYFSSCKLLFLFWRGTLPFAVSLLFTSWLIKKIMKQTDSTNHHSFPLDYFLHLTFLFI